MDFAGNLDLSLSPEFIRLKIPLVDQVLELLKKGLAQVWVTGEITKPSVRFVTGAGVIQVPIDTRAKPADRPLPGDLLAPPVGKPLPPPKEPVPPAQK
jgi:hypothetical protein